MKYVVLRDDDTHALTPVNYLEQLYRPFLDRGMSVGLATIPHVDTRITLANGQAELYLRVKNELGEGRIPIGRNKPLVDYLRANPGFEILQHGCHHNFHEFACEDPSVIIEKLEEGNKLLLEAGFEKPTTFVAPHDRFSRVGLHEVAKRFRVISAFWFELRKLSPLWWPNYAFKKFFSMAHWQVGNLKLLTHPGSLVTHTYAYDSILPRIKENIARRKLTVIMTHWWEFYRENRPDDALIDVLHQIANYLATDPNVKMVSFRDIADGKVPLN